MLQELGGISHGSYVTIPRRYVFKVQNGEQITTARSDASTFLPSKMTACGLQFFFLIIARTPIYCTVLSCSDSLLGRPAPKNSLEQGLLRVLENTKNRSLHTRSQHRRRRLAGAPTLLPLRACHPYECCGCLRSRAARVACGICISMWARGRALPLFGAELTV